MKYKFWTILITRLASITCLIVFFVYKNKFPNTSSDTTTTLKPVKYDSNYGIRSYTTNQTKRYEITGWILENKTAERKIILTNSDLSWQKEILVSPDVKIYVVDPIQQTLKSDQTSIEELLPHRFKVQCLCTDSKCTTINMISVIGQGVL